MCPYAYCKIHCRILILCGFQQVKFPKPRKHRLASLRELELKKRRGELLNADEVEGAWFKITSAIRNRLLGLPGGLAARVAGINDPQKIQAILTREVREILTNLSGDVDRLA
jgi:hypothetical protein